MHLILNKLKLLATVYIICLVFVATADCFSAEEMPEDAIIAIVNNNTIMYKQIKPSQTQIRYMQLVYSNAHGREMTAQELADELQKAKKGALVKEIWRIVREQSVEELGISVTQEEVDRKIQEMVKVVENTGISEEQILREARKKTFLIIKALKAWQKNPDKSKQIYKKLLEPKSITSHEWQIWRLSYGTPGKLKELQRLVPKTVDDMRKMSHESTKQDIIYEKLRNIFSKNITVTEEEVAEYYKKIYGEPLKEVNAEGKLPEETEDEYKKRSAEAERITKIKKQLRKDLLEQKKYKKEQEWLIEQYRKAKIEIKDERFKDVLEMLVPSAEKSRKMNSSLSP